MSTRVGIIAEGPIDQELIGPILSGIARDRNNITWPIDPEDLADFYICPFAVMAVYKKHLRDLFECYEDHRSSHIPLWLLFLIDEP